MEFSVAEIHEAIAATRPDAECLVFRDRRLTWADVTERTRRLANFLIDAGLGVHSRTVAAGGARERPGPPGRVPAQRQRIPRVDARCVQGARRPVQRELSLRRRRIALPADRFTSCGDRRAQPVRAHARRGASRPCRPSSDRAGARRIGQRSAPRRGLVRGCAGCCVTRQASGGLEPRRSVHPLHRRHHGHAEGRAVAQRRCQRRVLRWLGRRDASTRSSQRPTAG